VLLVVAACAPKTESADEPKPRPSSSAERAHDPRPRPSSSATTVDAAEGIWESGTVTLLLSKGPDVAEVVFVKNELVRIDYKTTDESIKEQVRARVEQLIATGKERGLSGKWHAPSDSPDEEGGLVGATARPGEPTFARLMYHHIGDKDGFNVRAK